MPGREILLGGGNVHCVTQQVPLARDRGAEAEAWLTVDSTRP